MKICGNDMLFVSRRQRSQDSVLVFEGADADLQVAAEQSQRQVSGCLNTRSAELAFVN